MASVYELTHTDAILFLLHLLINTSLPSCSTQPLLIFKYLKLKNIIKPYCELEL